MRYVPLSLLALMVWTAPASAQNGCAYPNFPDASCTGWQPTGVTLSPYTGPNPVTAAGTVIDGKQINGSLIIQASNVTVRRSRILGGRIETGHGQYSGILIEDTEVDGANSGGFNFSCIGDYGWTGRRLNIHGCGQGVQSACFTLEDSYIHDLYGESDWHSEAVLGKYSNAGCPVKLVHNDLQGKYGAQGSWSPTDGGMSSAVSFYTHGETWGSQSHVWFEKNRLSVGESGRDHAVYCLYAGTPDPTNTFSNATFKDNVFRRNASSGVCGAGGPVTSADNGGGGNCHANNRYEDGTSISINGGWATCSGSPPPPAACGDGQDNDGDGLVDLADPGCASLTDTDEFNSPPPPTSNVPPPWATVDVGNPTLTGSATHEAGRFTVIGAGIDIWDTADQFRFVYQLVSGDLDVIAKVESLQGPDDWSKGGVMIRSSLTAGSPNALAAATRANGWTFQRRLIENGVSLPSDGLRPPGVAPGWVKLTRRDQRIEGFYSPDGVTWQFINSDTVVMPPQVYVGLAVTSHNPDALATSVLSSVSVTTVSPPPAPACSDTLDNDSDGLTDLADPGCSDASDTDEFNVPPETTFTATMAVTKCRVTVTDTPPTSESGWGVQFRFDNANGTFTNIGNRDTSPPYTRTSTEIVSGGTYQVSALWTRSGSASVTRGPLAVTCPP